MKNIEVEYKLDANTPRAFAKVRHFLSTLPGPAPLAQILHIKDTYLDHDTYDLSAQKIALRVRNTDGRWEATFKTRTNVQNGKAVRREETLPLPRAHTLAQALAQLSRRQVWGPISLTNLVARFQICNKRTVYALIYQGCKLELALDNVTILVAGRQLKMKEIEIELKDTRVQSLEKFVQALQQHTGLKTATISKVKTAEKLLELIEMKK